MGTVSQVGAPERHTFAIKPDLVLRAGAAVFLVVRVCDDLVTLEHVVTNERKVIPYDKMIQEILVGTVVCASQGDSRRCLDGDVFGEDDNPVVRALLTHDQSDKQKAYALRTYGYIADLKKLGYERFSPRTACIQLVVDQIQRKREDPNKFPVTTLYAWALKYWDASENICALVPRYQERGGRSRPRIQAIIENTTSKILAEVRQDTTAKIKVRDIASRVSQRLAVEHPQSPNLLLSVNESTMSRRINESFSEYERCRRNNGVEAAKREFRSWYPRDAATFALEVFETDDTDTHEFLIDERSGLPFGRAYLTQVIDQHSSIPVGGQLGTESRSAWSAISALVNAVLPKDVSHEDFNGIKLLSEFYGKPGIVVFDNALQNHCDSLLLAASEIPTIAAWAKPKTPTEKSTQEGWFGVMKKKFLPNRPGFRGDKKSRDGLKSGAETAVATVQEFRTSLNRWIYNDYILTPSEGRGTTPYQRWAESMRLMSESRSIPCNIFRMKLIASLVVESCVRGGLVKLFGLHYQHPYLQEFQRSYGEKQKLSIRYIPTDLGTIFVVDRDKKQYINIACVDTEYSNGLTVYQQTLILKLARENGARNPALPELYVAREQLRLLTEQERHSKKFRDRKRAHQVGEIPTGGDLPSETTSNVQQITIIERVSTLEDIIAGIDESALDLAMEGWS